MMNFLKRRRKKKQTSIDQFHHRRKTNCLSRWNHLLACFFKLEFIRRARLSVWIDDSNACHMKNSFCFSLPDGYLQLSMGLFNIIRNSGLIYECICNQWEEEEETTNRRMARRQAKKRKKDLSRNQTNDRRNICSNSDIQSMSILPWSNLNLVSVVPPAVRTTFIGKDYRSMKRRIIWKFLINCKKILSFFSKRKIDVLLVLHSLFVEFSCYLMIALLTSIEKKRNWSICRQKSRITHDFTNNKCIRRRVSPPSLLALMCAIIVIISAFLRTSTVGLFQYQRAEKKPTE